MIFAKEDIGYINKNLLDRLNFICIIAGYEDVLEKYFLIIMVV